MANWLHCNKCFKRFQSNLKFFLTECGHVECYDCVRLTEENNGACLVCNKKTKTLLLSETLNPDIECYFKPIDRSIDQMKKVYEFQHANIISLLNKLNEKYNYAKKEVFKCYKIIDEYKKQNNKLKAMLKAQYSRPGHPSWSTSTPMIPSPSLFNASTSLGPKTVTFTPTRMETNTNDTYTTSVINIPSDMEPKVHNNMYTSSNHLYKRIVPPGREIAPLHNSIPKQISREHLLKMNPFQRKSNL